MRKPTDPRDSAELLNSAELLSSAELLKFADPPNPAESLRSAESSNAPEFPNPAGFLRAAGVQKSAELLDCARFLIPVGRLNSAETTDSADAVESAESLPMAELPGAAELLNSGTPQSLGVPAGDYLIPRTTEPRGSISRSPRDFGRGSMPETSRASTSSPTSAECARAASPIGARAFPLRNVSPVSAPNLRNFRVNSDQEKGREKNARRAGCLVVQIPRKRPYPY